MKKIVLSSICAFLFFAAFSQEKQLLQDFKYRINRFRAFNFSGGGNSNHSSEKLANENSGTYINLGGNLTQIKSTDRFLVTATYFLNSSLSSGVNKNNDIKSRGRSYSLYPGVDLHNRWFYSKNRFAELGISSTVGNQRSWSKNDAMPITGKSNYNYYNLFINTGIGIGRLENVTDMQNALWLNRALKEDKFLNRNLTPKELNQLGRTITRVNNTRILDFRKRIQFILENTDSFFQQQQLINKTDIRYFTHLNDILFFAINNVRFAGTEKFIRFTPSFGGNWSNIKYSDNINKAEGGFDSQGLDLAIGINHYSPKSLTRQVNTGVSIKLKKLSAGFIDRKFVDGNINSEVKTDNEYKSATIIGFYEYACYPNTRTTINARLSTELGPQRANNQSDFFTNVILAANSSYFINFNTRLNFGLSATYQENSYMDLARLQKHLQSFRLFANASIDISF